MNFAASERVNQWQLGGGMSGAPFGVARDILAIEARLAALEASRPLVVELSGLVESIAGTVAAIEARLTALESSRPVQPATETAAAVANDPERDNEASDGPGRGYRWRPGFVPNATTQSASPAGERMREGLPVADSLPDDAGRRLVAGEPMTAAEMMHALTVARQEIARLTAERDAARAEVERTIAARNAAIGERDEFRKSWLSATDHATRLVSQRDAALAEVERHRMTTDERESALLAASMLASVNDYGVRIRGYLERTKEGE